MAEGKDDREMNGRGGMLSIVDLRAQIVPAKNVEGYLSLFEKRDWDGIIETFGEIYERKFVIKDYNELNLTPFSYDLSIGHQLFSIQRPDPRVVSITDEQPYGMEPGETVVVITKEYIALPPCYSATVWPRFKMVRSGIFQSMVKIDPTWYGKLAVAMSNLSPATQVIERDKPFGTLVLYELSVPADVDLWKHINLEEVDVQLPEELEGLQDQLDNFLFANEKLKGHCRIKGNILKIRGIKREQLEALNGFYRSKPWRDFVEVIGNTWAEAKHSKIGRSKIGRRMIGMEGLGMMDLEPILQGATRGERVKREVIEIGKCRQEELISAAIQYGKPFDIFARIPDTIVKRIEDETIPKIEAEIQSKIQTRVIVLVFSLFGFISLVLTILVMLWRLGGKDFLEKFSNWPGLYAVLTTGGAVFGLGFLLVGLIWIRSVKRGVGRVRSNLEKQRLEIEQRKEEFEKRREEWSRKLRKWENKQAVSMKKFKKSMKKLDKKNSERKSRV